MDIITPHHIGYYEIKIQKMSIRWIAGHLFYRELIMLTQLGFSRKKEGTLV